MKLDNNNIIKKIQTITIIVLIILCVALSLSFYRGTRDRNISDINNRKIVEYLNNRNNSLRDSMRVNNNKLELIKQLVIKNKQDESKQILDIINLSDSIKLQQLQSRYNY